MKRRQFLSIAGSAVIGSVAGCVRPRYSTLNESVSVGSGASNLKISVKNLEIRQSLLYRNIVHPQIKNQIDKQYLIFGIDAIEGRPQDIDDLLLENMNLIYSDESINTIQGVRIPPTDGNELEHDTYTMYEVPRKPSIQNAELLYSGETREHRWSVDSMIQKENLDSYVQNPPEVRINSMSVPDTTDGENVEITVTAAEVSGTSWDGVEPFRFLLGSTALSALGPYGVEVPSGETVTETIDVPLFTDGKKATIKLDWGVDTIEKSVEVR